MSAVEIATAYISIVPTGNGELIIRQAAGWALVHP